MSAIKNKKINKYPNSYKNKYYLRLNKICKKRLQNKDAEAFRLRLLDPAREYNRLLNFWSIIVFNLQIIRQNNRSDAWSFLEKYVFKPDLMKDHTLTVFYQVFWLRPNVRANTRFHFSLLYLQKILLLPKPPYIMILPEVCFSSSIIYCRLIFDDVVCPKTGLNCYTPNPRPQP